MADEIKIPVFDGKDYSTWKKRLLTFLKLKKCDDACKREKIETDDEAIWNEKDLKAVNYIYSALSNRQMEFVNDEETAYKILEKLDRMYLRESTALQICVRNKLEKLKLKEYGESSDFFSDFEKLVIELKNAGAQVTEKEKLNYLLRTLPSTLSYIGDLIDVLKEEDQTVDFVKNKIKMYEAKEKEENGGKNQGASSNAFKIEKKKERTCYKCGKQGHLQYECTNTQNPGNTWKNRRGGVHQERQGDARNWSNSNTQHRFGTGRGGNQRGRGGNWTNQRQGQRGGWQNHRNGQRETTHPNSNERNEHNIFCTEIGTVNPEESGADNNCENCVEWVLDSGCTDHIVNKKDYFSDSVFLEVPVDVKIGDGKILKATRVGTVFVNFIVHGRKTEVKMQNVFYVKEMDRNLISVGRVTVTNKVVSVGNTAKIYNGNNDLIAIAYKVNNMYKMSSVVGKKETYLTMNENKTMTLKERFHRMLGHVNFNYLNVLCEDRLVDGMPNKLESEYLKCGTCVQNKMPKVMFKNNRQRAKDILEIIHTDLNGPHNTTGFMGEKYFLLFIDDYSKIAKVYTIKSKTEVYGCFVEYLNQVENLTGKRVKRLRCDNGKEYMNRDFYKLAKEKGIFIEPCPPYVHELNGTAERYNRSVMDIARCLLADAKVDKRFWPEVVKTAVYLKNRTLANTLEKKTPYEIMMGQKPDISNLRLYGSRVFVRTPENKRHDKWDRRAEIGILLGYENVGYRVLINDKIVIARHVDIVEEHVNLVGYKGEGDSNYIPLDEDRQEDNSFIDNNERILNERRQSDENTEGMSEVRRSSRVRSKPDRYTDENYAYCIYVNYVSADAPESYNEAISSNDSKNWQDAMNREIDCLNKNDTWTLVRRPENNRILDLKWVFTKKIGNVFKARLVVRGFQQKETIDDIYSPVARMQTLKLLLSYCVQNGLRIIQMDVETAFLNGKIVSEVYVKQPQGYNDRTDRVYKLRKALYGLRESPRIWYECFDTYLKGLGFKRSKNDYCLYSMNDRVEKIYLIIFVDDLLICCKSNERLNLIKGLLMKKFQMKDMGEIKSYLGINIEYDYRKQIMTLDQKAYIESLAIKYGIENAKLYNTPMEQNLKCEPAQSASDNLNYRNLIGALLYVSSGTRLDICYSVNYLSRFQNCYDQTHFKYALRVLKYLYRTRNLKLTYEMSTTADMLECFVDADWAGDVIDRKSTTGYVIKMYGNVIYWKSKKQGSVTKSSTAAEYVALSEAVSELKLIRDVLDDLELKLDKPINVYEDNSGAVTIAKFGNFTKNSKYIETHYHFVNENYLKGVIDVKKIDSEDNIADICTKALSRIKFEKFRDILKLM